MNFPTNGSGIVLLPLSPEELANIVRANVRAELESLFPADTPAKTSEKERAEVLLTVEQTTEMLDVSRVTLNDWEKKKILLPVRLGRRVYYKRGDIYKALHTHETITKGTRRTQRKQG